VPTLSIPPIYVEPPIPTPPGTINAPVVVDDDGDVAERYKDVPVAAPMFGVTKTGPVANTSAPDPVSSDMTFAKSLEEVMTDAVPELYLNKPVEEEKF
jgi:hypothetical protein